MWHDRVDAFLAAFLTIAASLLALQGLLGLAGARFAPGMLQWRLFRGRGGAIRPRADHIIMSSLQFVAGSGLLASQLRVGPVWFRCLVAIGTLALLVFVVGYHRRKRTH